MRLIDADEFVEIVNYTHSRPPFSRKTVLNMIKMTRTLDVVPVKRGKWNETGDRGGRNYACGCCRFTFIVDTCMGEPMWNYCPNCGARMDGGEG